MHFVIEDKIIETIIEHIQESKRGIIIEMPSWYQ
jgi:hypothetical protein